MKNSTEKRYYMWIFVVFLLMATSVLAKETAGTAMSSSDSGVDTRRTRMPFSEFNDPVLNDLVARAMQDNSGIDAALARIDLAETAARASLAPLLPTVYGEGSYFLNSYSSPTAGMNLPANMSQDTPNYMQTAAAKLVASYQLDISGRYHKARAAALREVSASKEDVQSLGMSIVTLIVQNYYDIVAANRRIELLEEQVENYEKLLQLVVAQFDVGSASSLDVLQQRAQLESKKSQLPLARTIVESAKIQLAALLNTQIESLPEMPSMLPRLGDTPAIENETQLRRRLMMGQPALRAAQIRLDALKLKEISARRALYPTLGLLGAVGYQWKRVDDWINNETWQIGATLTVPIYMGGANRAGIRQAEAATVSAEYALEDSLLQSRTRVFAARERERAQKEYLDALRAQTETLELTVQEATRKYMAGLSNYLNVLTANDVLQLNQLNVVQAERNLLSARVSLLEALGGDWTQNLVASERSNK